MEHKSAKYVQSAVYVVVVCLIILTCVSDGSDENELWLLISSYEDPGMNVQDLARFLEDHGYNVGTTPSYVTIGLSTGRVGYLTPSGVEGRLADLWLNPPEGISYAAARGGDEPSPAPVATQDTIIKNVRLSRTGDAGFVSSIRAATSFPATPYGQCLEGAEKIGGIYKDLGYNVLYLYDTGGEYSHIWIAVENPNSRGTWEAVDSYYGPTDDEWYYSAPYGFSRMKSLGLLKPVWKIFYNNG